jgi:hypothetical protein
VRGAIDNAYRHPAAMAAGLMATGERCFAFRQEC